MADKDKDNANPTVHQPALTSVRRPASNGAKLSSNDWWRDLGIHGAPSKNRRSPGGFGSDDEDDEEEDSDDATMVDETVQAGKAEVKKLSLGDEEKIDAQEVFDLVRSISDPEHPLTLEQLAVVRADQITVTHGDSSAKGEARLPRVRLEFTPTIPHCSMATLIGLALRVRLLRSLPPRFKVDITIKPGTHQSERAVNKQLNDKERVAAALENESLLTVVSDCIATANRRGLTEEEAMREAEKRARELGLVN